MIEIAPDLAVANAFRFDARITGASGRDFVKRQGGAISVMFAVLILVLFGFIGLAFDLGMLYNRKVELQNAADAVALAAASELVGTKAGVQSALTQAAATATGFKYQYNKKPFIWSVDAIKFSTVASMSEGDWLDAGAAEATPDGLLFAKVDTSKLDEPHGTFNTLFMRIFSSAQASVPVLGLAVAGRYSIKVTPLAICALSPTPAVSRSNPGPPPNSELEEYGFRRGVAYDLMNLNPNLNATTPENFVVDPIDRLGTSGSPANTAPGMVGPFVCSGSMPMPRVMGDTITVARPFPIGALFNQLNSRFDQYPGGLCSPNEAPPDANVRAYVPASIPWMTTVPTSQAAASTTTGGKLWTIASPLPAPATNTAPMYGPLWSFARAVPFSAYAAGVAEPASGYATFGTATWSTLYNPGKPVFTGPVSTIPYLANAGANFFAPSLANRPGVRFRRVLNVPLLSCPVPAGTNVSATVLAIGRFFMTVPATATTVHAEFAGLVPEQALGGPVELYP